MFRASAMLAFPLLTLSLVTARLSKGMLSYRFDKQGWNGRLRRCS